MDIQLPCTCRMWAKQSRKLSRWAYPIKVSWDTTHDRVYRQPCSPSPGSWLGLVDSKFRRLERQQTRHPWHSGWRWWCSSTVCASVDTGRWWRRRGCSRWIWPFRWWSWRSGVCLLLQSSTRLEPGSSRWKIYQMCCLLLRCPRTEFRCRYNISQALLTWELMSNSFSSAVSKWLYKYLSAMLLCDANRVNTRLIYTCNYTGNDIRNDILNVWKTPGLISIELSLVASGRISGNISGMIFLNNSWN